MNSNAAFTINSETEELLVHFLDGTLSASEQDRFEALLRENPSFAEEVRAITSFDTMLDDAQLEKRWTDRADTAFLSEVQQQFAQAVVLGTATALVGTSAAASGVSASGFSASSVSASAAGTTGTGLGLTTVTKTASALGLGKFATLLTGTAITKVVLLAALCGGIGYGTWKYAASTESVGTVSANSNNNTSTTPAPVQLAPASPQSQSPAQATPASLPKGTGNLVPTERSQAKTTEIPQHSVPTEKAVPQAQRAPVGETASNLPEQDNKTSANIESNAALDLRTKIEQLAALVRTKEQNGDKAGLAFDAKKLGMLERTAGKFSESNEHFEKALKAAQALKLRELEGEIKAESALLFKEQGNTEKALLSLREAVKILSEENSSKAAKWSKELDRWEKR